MPGKKPASTRPRKNRAAERPADDLTSDVKEQIMPQRICPTKWSVFERAQQAEALTVMIGMYQRGPVLLTMMFDGISKTT